MNPKQNLAPKRFTQELISNQKDGICPAQFGMFNVMLRWELFTDQINDCTHEEEIRSFRVYGLIDPPFNKYFELRSYFIFCSK